MTIKKRRLHQRAAAARYIGKRFGRLVGVEYGTGQIDPPRRRPTVLCRCECGSELWVRAEHLTRNLTNSCGCLREEMRTTHGLSATPEYSIWAAMKNRCLCPTDKHYRYYGGRGIAVCDRWLTFECFIADMGFRPSPAHTLDRKNNNGNYEPKNCRWATCREQARNTRANRLVTFAGETRCVSEWAERIGIAPNTLWYRLERWPLERALTLPSLANQ